MRANNTEKEVLLQSFSVKPKKVFPNSVSYFHSRHKQDAYAGASSTCKAWNGSWSKYGEPKKTKT